MIRKTHLPYIITLLLFFTFSSCKKLDEKPLGFVEPKDFYNTPTQIIAAYTASMQGLWENWSGYQYPGILYFINDDQLRGGNLVIPNNFAADLWARHYSSISNVNAAIAAIKRGNLGSTISQTETDQLMGQGEFIRAWNYFMLVRLWGDIPLISDDTPDPIQNPPSRTPVADVYKSIVTDLLDAAAKLPVTWPADQSTRPTRDAAKGMLAKVYLTMATAPLNQTENYAKAADMAKQVMDAGTYSLIHDIDKVFTVDSRYGPEVMFTFTANYADQTMNGQAWYPPMLGGWANYTVESAWGETYPETPRKDAYLLTYIDGVKYTNWPGSNSPFIKKYMYSSASDYDAYRSIIVMPILRFADVVLAFAEADNMANGAPTPEAVAALNSIINRANGYVSNPNHPLATTAMTKIGFDTTVIEERNQELCFELGDRWFDLVRKRIVKQKNLPFYQQNFTDDDYLYPIPDNEIRLNPEITQNPGYTLP